MRAALGLDNPEIQAAGISRYWCFFCYNIRVKPADVAFCLFRTGGGDYVQSLGLKVVGRYLVSRFINSQSPREILVTFSL